MFYGEFSHFPVLCVEGLITDIGCPGIYVRKKAWFHGQVAQMITYPEEGGVLRMNRATEIFTLYGFMH